MEEIKQYKTSNLVLQVNKNYNPEKLPLGEWDRYLDMLCANRPYQIEAIKQAIIFLASGQYNSTADLVTENLNNNKQADLKSRYKLLADYKNHLQLPNKLSANIDLATGTGKSYVIFGIAQIMLGLGLVDRVLVLCPSLTIESGLLEKFNALASDKTLRYGIPDSAKYKNLAIKSADVTIKKGDICVENIHAVYSKTGSSIKDSFTGNGDRTLVLNDESHHIFNKTTGNSSEARDIKKWKAFLLDEVFSFKYILGFTGTAYIDDEYFNDVIYRYSLRKAIDSGVVKTIDYVSIDEDTDKNVKFQKIYGNHKKNRQTYRKIDHPLTIFVTKDIANAKKLATIFTEFLQATHKLSEQEAKDKILVVTSHKDHKANIPILKQVDNEECKIEWIISVSMLTEGWDVKNVLQIVPWEDRAFNSKLLIAQVLGRGLRLPPEYQTPQPKVRVFNHAAWSRNIQGLVDEILEIEMRLKSTSLQTGREKYHFTLHNIDYDKDKITKNKDITEGTYNYTKKPIQLQSQILTAEKETEYTDIAGGVRSKNTLIHYNTCDIDDIANNIINNLKVIKWEGNILKLDTGLYSKEKLPSKNDIINLIKKSMQEVGINGNKLNEENKQRVENSFNTLLRKFRGTTRYSKKAKAPYEIDTNTISAESMALSNLRQGSTVFYSSDYNTELEDDNKQLLNAIIEDESLPRSAEKSINVHKFKTPLNLIFTNKKPERIFVSKLCDNSKLFDAWIKSRNMGFYSIDYSITTSGGKHSKNKLFNPDFFIKVTKNNITHYIVIEIKADDDVSTENRAKYKYAKQHFTRLNNKLKNKKEIYHFCFLSPVSYDEFFNYLKNDKLLFDQFKSALEVALLDDASINNHIPSNEKKPTINPQQAT